MGCSSCSSGGGTPGGCKSNGSCGTGGCNKLNVFDWLTNMEMPSGVNKFDVVEVRFKNSRKAFYRNIENLNLQVGDVVVVESSPGHDVGVVSVEGELTRLQVKRKQPGLKAHELKKVYRKAHEGDIEKWMQARELEKETMYAARTLAIEHGLQMKISDVEYQGDKSKATFYYTAEQRVDFRTLIKAMASKFSTRIEMRQIGARQEAGRLGGIGSCGRELCCSTWLTDFRSVSTSAARYQQLALNPQKLAGQCGKLKCCLNYELDQYVEAFKKFPDNNIKLKTGKGLAFHMKTDIFKGLMWYCYQDDFAAGFIPLKRDRVKEIIEMNKKGESPADLKDFSFAVEVEVEPKYDNVVGQDSLTRFDTAFKKKKKSGKKRPNNNRNKNKQGGNSNQKNAKGNNQKPNAKKKQGPGNKPNNNKLKGNKNPNNQKANSNNPNQKQGGNRPNNNKPRPKKNSNKPKQKPADEK